jgi:hypothetical protein
MTDTNGEATLCLPFDAETSYTKTREGYGSYLQALVVPVNGLAYTTFMATEARLATQLGNVMSPDPMMGTGIVLVSMSPACAGATFDLSDASGKATGKPFYRDEELNWRLDLTATTADGAGGFTEVPPGEYQVLFGGTAGGCIPERGWPGRFVENSVRFPVLEGHMTQVTLVCLVCP